MKGMTPDHSRESRCYTCKSATIVKGYAESQQIIECSALSCRVPFPVYECSAYKHKLELTLYQLMSMGQIVEKKDNKIGFRPLTREEINSGYDTFD